LVGSIAGSPIAETVPLSAMKVRIRRHSNAVILERIANGWAWLDKIVGKLRRGLCSGRS
jgi:hypothetical protein